MTTKTKKPKVLKLPMGNFDIDWMDNVLLTESGSAYGLCYFKQGKIVIDEDTKQPLQDLVLMHEICHMMLFAAGRTDEAVNEDLIEGLSTQLLYFIRHNKHILEWLQ